METNSDLKKEIDLLFEKYQLNNLFRKYGELSVAGSYVYNLMAWRDFDVVLKTDNLTSEVVYSLISGIGKSINPDELKVLNNINRFDKNRPIGYWIGIYVEKWKIDLWVMDKENSEKEIEQTQKLDKLLSNVDKDELIKLKIELSKNPDYHKKFSSVDLYNSYLDGVRSTEGFFKWLKKSVN